MPTLAIYIDDESTWQGESRPQNIGSAITLMMRELVRMMTVVDANEDESYPVGGIRRFECEACRKNWPRTDPKHSRIGD